MAIPKSIDFGPGVTVNIIVITGTTFTGEILDTEDNFLLLQLTTAVGPYAAGTVVRINMATIISVG